ncbi:hypothetical protein PR048_008982 [Dryococelus australis]|uniref:Uncharacterized protein n=1 Tax=Dryococelus australis TaxID=614101 RepID=A0ABQ9HYM6_9NEOP|nr:hypothetical protein PR048_008982 [Dryococelus australis]
MEQRRNERVGETGDPRENPPTSGIVRFPLAKTRLVASGKAEVTIVRRPQHASSDTAKHLKQPIGRRECAVVVLQLQQRLEGAWVGARGGGGEVESRAALWVAGRATSDRRWSARSCSRSPVDALLSRWQQAPVTTVQPGETECIPTTHKRAALHASCDGVTSRATFYWWNCKQASNRVQHTANASLPCNSSPHTTVTYLQLVGSVDKGCSRSTVSTLAFHQGEQGLIPGRATGFSQVGIVPDDAVDRRVFSGISRFPRPFISAPLHIHFNYPHRLKTSLLRAAQISSLTATYIGSEDTKIVASFDIVLPL